MDVIDQTMNLEDVEGEGTKNSGEMKLASEQSLCVYM